MERGTLVPSSRQELREFHPSILGIYTRRLGSVEAANAFLAAAESTAPLPCDLVGVDEAVDRIEQALDANEPIVVFGHDDPDGITSAAIVIETLETLGANVDGYIPNRVVEGHGLYADLIRKFAARGIRLVVTTDGCTMNRAEADLAAELGMDVVVTDHHEASGNRPTVSCLVNPKARPGRTDCTDLTGAGVAALVMRELLHRRPEPNPEPDEDDRDTDIVGAGRGALEGGSVLASDEHEDSEDDRACPREAGADPGFGMAAECRDSRFFRLLDLVALGTIADYGDLGRNNRAMVVRGLTAVARGDRPAVALARRALEIGPPAVLRVEKAARLAAVFAAVPSTDGHSPGLDALLGRDSWAGAVDDLLRAFLKAEDEIQAGVDTVAELAASAMENGEPLVVRVTEIAPRAVGKAAGHLLEQTGRPAAVLRIEEERVVGELRGGDEVNLVAILESVASSLSSWGGHRQAAGFSAPLAEADVIEKALATAFAATTVPPLPQVRAEVTISRADINSSFSRSLRAAMPFGRGNPTPAFRVRDYRQGGTQREADRRRRVTVLLHEPDFPERPLGKVPLVTFHARGAGGLRARFVGWADEPESEL